jgi:hypothetical protein
VREVEGKVVKEVVIVYGFIAIDLVALCFLLHSAEVVIFLQFESILAAQSLEGFVTSHFSEWGHLEGALGDSLTVILNLADGPGKTIELGDMLRREDEAVVDALALGAA